MLEKYWQEKLTHTKILSCGEYEKLKKKKITFYWVHISTPLCWHWGQRLLVGVISLYHMGPRDQTQVIRLGSNIPSLLSHNCKHRLYYLSVFEKPCHVARVDLNLHSLCFDLLSAEITWACHNFDSLFGHMVCHPFWVLWAMKKSKTDSAIGQTYCSSEIPLLKQIVPLSQSLSPNCVHAREYTHTYMLASICTYTRM